MRSFEAGSGMAAGMSLAFDRNRFCSHGTHVRRAAFAAGIIAMQCHAKWCAATPQALIEVNAAQTKQGEWRVCGPSVMRVHRSCLPSTSSKHLNFLVSQPTTTLSHATPKHTHFLPYHRIHLSLTHSQTSLHPFSPPHPHRITPQSHSTASSTCAPSSSSASPRSSRALLVRLVRSTHFQT